MAGVRHAVGPDQIDAHGLLEDVRLVLALAAGEHRAGVVDEDIECAERAGDEVDLAGVLDVQPAILERAQIFGVVAGVLARAGDGDACAGGDTRARCTRRCRSCRR